VNENEINFADRVKAWRARHSLVQTAAAHILGIGRTYFSEIENGRAPGDFLRRKFEQVEHASLDHIRRLVGSVDIYQRAPDTARINEEPQPPGAAGANSLLLRRVPLVGWAQAMDAVTLIDFADVVDWEEFAPTDLRDPKAIAVRIRGDSMEPLYKEGDIAILACSAEPVSGNLIVGRLKLEGAVFKMFQVLRVTPKPCYRLESFNPHYAAIERGADDFLWIYPVHSVIKKLM
jgi:phage repressor protein C with HTH and peptisase S24 domain